MNLQLLPPAEQNYPELLEDCIEEGEAQCARWNRQGSYLAVGCRDGRCYIWDYMTRGVARTLEGHVRPVTCISWSHNGRYLLSSAADWNCICWDLQTGERRATARFESIVMSSSIHPYRDDLFVACTFMGPVVQVRILPDGRKRRRILYAGDGSDDDLAKNFVVTLCFDRRGHHLYLGTYKGKLAVLNSETGEILYRMQISSSCIRQIHLSKRDNYLAVNSLDRTIRVFDVNITKSNEHDNPTITLVQRHKFQDVIDRHQWNQCTFSSDEEYVIGGSAHKAEHNVYIWDLQRGSLVKMVEGPKETVEDVCWHSFLPVMATVSVAGRVYLWSVHREEHWKENTYYVEREDEFDMPMPTSKSVSSSMKQQPQQPLQHDYQFTCDNNDVDIQPDIDVVSITDPNPYDDSDGESDTIVDSRKAFYIPIELNHDALLQVTTTETSQPKTVTSTCKTIQEKTERME
ncbi:WD40-repeat-containing domain protein [Syncephalis plumigaleata]|nr:WD40-repeat-containing domain protein [Syncephalis plumigaleata]